MNPSFDNDQYLVMNKEEGDDEMVCCWSGDDGDWFFDKVGRDFPNKSKDLYNITDAMLKKGEGKNGKP